MVQFHHGTAGTGLWAFVVFLVVGGLAGWAAGLIVRGSGFGIVGNVVVGIVGAMLAGWLLPTVGLYIFGGVAAAFVDAVIGAVILLAAVGLLRRLWARPAR